MAASALAAQANDPKGFVSMFRLTGSHEMPARLDRGKRRRCANRSRRQFADTERPQAEYEAPADVKTLYAADWRTRNNQKRAYGVVKMMGRLLVVVSMVGVLAALAGCNTIAGFGQDITDSARAVQRVL